MTWKLKNGQPVVVRPIRVEDESMMLELFRSFSSDTVRYRFFHIICDMPHEELVRYCSIDFVAELAFVAEIEERGRKQLIGVVRLCLEQKDKTGEFAVVIADRWQKQGLGRRLVEYIIDISKSKKMKSIYGIILSDNVRMIRLVKSLGFQIKSLGDGTIRATLSF
ncbi:MAG: GNAT family N-acetyltransferase [Candidatus Odinarchaeota archaeon]